MRNILSALMIILSVFTGSVLSASVASATAAPLPACIHEDGSGQDTACYWDASEQGNGQGLDVINYPDGTFELVTPAQPELPAAQPVVEAPAVQQVQQVQPAQDHAAAAWDMFDATSAADLLPDTDSTVTFTGHSTAPFELTADTITVWDNHGNHYQFAVTTN